MEHFMVEAFEEAHLALKEGEVPVGCIFVYDNKIIARGRNEVNATKNATRHAEFVCIDQTIAFAKTKNMPYKDVFAQTSVIVTVEPCIMCSAALHDLGVKEIIYGCANDRFGGQTVLNVPHLMGKEIPIVSGVRSEEAMELLKVFYKCENPSAPVSKSR